MAIQEPPLNADLEAIVDAFESSYSLRCEVDLTEFLPGESHPFRAEIAAELVRIDLERRYRGGTPLRLEAYQHEVPFLFHHRALLESVAFEEYRQRSLSGEVIDLKEYERRFAIATTDWPTLSYANGEANGSFQTDLNSVAEELTQLGEIESCLPANGDRFAGFEIGEMLGQGAFSRVYRARQEDLAHREVVLKITADSSVEPQRLAKLQHTSIVPIHSVHRENGLLGVCMPYLGSHTLKDAISELPSQNPQLSSWLAGSTLRMAGDHTLQVPPGAEGQPATLPTGSKQVAGGMANRGPVEESIAAQIILQLARGLHHAHERGVVHCDVKPANVLMADDLVPRLLDFNLANDISHTPRATLLVGGTLPYMAPEHLAAVSCGGKVGPESDIFSLGAIFYEMLTGHCPFPRRQGQFDEIIGRMRADRERERPSVRRHCPQVSPALDAIISKCLEPNVALRYQSAADLAEDIQRHVDDLPLKHAQNNSWMELSQKWFRRNRRIAQAAATIVLISALLATALLARSRGRSLETAQVLDSLRQFSQLVSSARLGLSAPDSTADLRALGRQHALNALEVWNQAIANSSGLDSIGVDAHQQITENLVDLNFLLAEAEVADSQGLNSDQREGKLRQALSYAQAAESFNSRTAAVYHQQADILDLLDEEALAGRVRKKSADLPHDTALDAYYQLSHLQKRPDYSAALADLERLCRVRSADPLVWFYRGNAHAGLGQLSDAESCFNAVLVQQPDSIEAISHRGIANYEQGEYSQAIADFDRALEIRPGLVCALLNRGLAYKKLRQWEQAELDFSAAIEKGAKWCRVYLKRAEVRLALGNASGAKEDREQALSVAPRDDRDWAMRGLECLDSDPNQALVEFQSGLERFPNSKFLLQNALFVTADKLGNPQQAMQYCDALLQLNEKDMDSLAAKAVLLARLGKRLEAFEFCKRAMERNPPPKTLLQLAGVFSRTSAIAEADTLRAFYLLSAALQKEPRLVSRLREDPDFEPISEHPTFIKLTTAANDLSAPAIVPEAGR